jgi:uncharacterized membrane-anchored protein
MEQSAVMQLCLQQLVEGLSVVALSYYLIGLAGYLFKAIENLAPGSHASSLTGWLVLPVVLGTWLSLKALKHRVLGKA